MTFFWPHQRGTPSAPPADIRKEQQHDDCKAGPLTGKSPKQAVSFSPARTNAKDCECKGRWLDPVATMLPFLLPSASLARATPQLARQLQSIIKSRQIGPCQRCASNVAGRASRASSEQEDLGESDDPPHVHSHRGRQTPFSHFFDRRVPVTPSIQEPRFGDSKASYDITAASRQATTALRRAVSSGHRPRSSIRTTTSCAPTTNISKMSPAPHPNYSLLPRSASRCAKTTYRTR